MEHITAMFFFAGIGAVITCAIMAFSKRAIAHRRFALSVQAIAILGLGFLFFIGAGLQSPPGYPHWLIPFVFLIVLAITNLIWRAAVFTKAYLGD